MTVNYEIGKPRNDKRMRITLLLCIGKTKKRIKTDIFATAADLNRKGKLRNDSPVYAKVRAFSVDTERQFASLDTFLTGERLSAREAAERMSKKEEPMFFAFADRWLSRQTMKGKKNYICALNSFKGFVKTDIKFSSITHRLLDDYCFFLRNKPRAQSMYLSVIKRIYSEAEKDYDIKAFSSLRFDVPRQRMTRHRALDIDIIRKVFLWKGKGRRAALARDCAILSFCLCGTNSADLFNAPHIKKNILSYERTKTKDRRIDNAHIEITIPRQIRKLVKEYRSTSRAFSFHTMYKDESAFNQNINIGLKTIGKDIGVEGLNFYAFRHSWASIARNDLGIEKSTIHEALCHIDRETAIDDIYIKKDFTNIDVANKKVVDYVFKEIPSD